LEDFLEGGELRVGYGMETEFLGWVNLVKENTLSGIGSPGLVGLAPGYDLAKPGEGFFLIRELSGLAGLRSDKAKTSPQGSFSLVLKPRPG
jgi:hypothetical protein